MSKSKRVTKKIEKNMELKNEAVIESVDSKPELSEQALIPNIYLQFAGNEYNEKEIIEQIKETWYNEAGEDSSIDSMEVYLKPEEYCAYYVINAAHQGKIDL